MRPRRVLIFMLALLVLLAGLLARGGSVAAGESGAGTVFAAAHFPQAPVGPCTFCAGTPCTVAPGACTALAAPGTPLPAPRSGRARATSIAAARMAGLAPAVPSPPPRTFL